MSETNRHREPTIRQRVNSIYRRQLEHSERFEAISETLSIVIVELVNENKTLRRHLGVSLGHSARLLDEKDTLVQLIGWPEIQRRLNAANAYMAAPPKWQDHVHREPGQSDGEKTIAVPEPSASEHVYTNAAAKRCSRCDCLRIAIEASGVPCANQK